MGLQDFIPKNLVNKILTHKSLALSLCLCTHYSKYFILYLKDKRVIIRLILCNFRKSNTHLSKSVNI